jgi:hypothetical protein
MAGLAEGLINRVLSGHGRWQAAVVSLEPGTELQGVDVQLIPAPAYGRAE